MERSVRGRPVLLPGAIDSILNLAPQDIEGIEAAKSAVTDAAKATVEAWRAGDQIPEGRLDTLAGAVDALRAEEDNPGGACARSGTWCRS